MDKFRVFVYMLMKDMSLKQRILCIIHISIFGAFSAEKKCTLYRGKYGMFLSLFFFVSQSVNFTFWQFLRGCSLLMFINKNRNCAYVS